MEKLIVKRVISVPGSVFIDGNVCDTTINIEKIVEFVKVDGVYVYNGETIRSLIDE